jgi:hypothetical protein
MSFSFSVLCMQVDIFLAIFWSIRYKNRVTTYRARIACCLSLLLSIIISCVMNIIDRSYTNCLYPISLLYTKTTNITLEGIPRLLAVAATVAVSIYAVIVDKQLAKVEPSPVNMPSSSQGDTRRVQRLNTDPHVFFITDACNLNTGHEDTTPFVTMLKNTKIMNIISLTFLISFPFTAILGMTNINCDIILGECDYYLLLFKFFAPCCFVSLILFWYRLVCMV